MTYALMIVFIAAMIAIIGFFAGVETGLFSVSHPKVRNLAGKGDRRARIIADLLERPDEFIGTALVGINLAHVTLAAVSTWFLNSIFTRPAVSAAVTTVVITPLILLFGEIIPKAICRLRPHTTTLSSARLFGLVHTLLWPATGAVLAISRTILPSGWQEAEKNVENRRDEILAILKEGEKSGAVEDDEKEMIEAALELGETTLKQVMVPRVAICSIASDMTSAEIIERALADGYTRYPLYEETPDRIVGILHVADLLEGEKPQGETIVAPLFLSEFTKVDDALEQMRAEGRHMAIVVDEYGGTAGLVTIEDLLEELVGEIEDEFDDAHPRAVAVAENRWQVDGRADLGEAVEELGLAFDEEPFEAETVGGLIMEKLGRIPRTGDAVRIGRFRFTAVAADDRRVLKAEIERLNP